MARVLALAVSLVALAAAGCGGSSSSSSSPPDAGAPPASTGSTSPTPQVAPATTTSAPGPDTVTGILPPAKPKPPLIAALTATGHRPVAGDDWTFIVKSKNKDGTPTVGTVRAILLSNGKLYDTIGWFGFSGELKHSVVFPLERKDLSLVFQAQVIANGGVVNLNYPIKVQ